MDTQGQTVSPPCSFEQRIEARKLAELPNFVSLCKCEIAVCNTVVKLNEESEARIKQMQDDNKKRELLHKKFNAGTIQRECDTYSCDFSSEELDVWSEALDALADEEVEANKLAIAILVIINQRNIKNRRTDYTVLASVPLQFIETWHVVACNNGFSGTFEEFRAMILIGKDDALGAEELVESILSSRAN